MKIGYIGSGPISNFHIPAIKKNGIDISAIGSKKDSKSCKDFSKFHNLENKFCEAGWEEVLSKNLDAYYICIKVEATLNVLLKALDKNKPVFVEKPIIWHPQDFKDLLEHKNSKNIFVGFNRRYYKTTRTLKNLCNLAHGGTIYLNIPESDYGIKQFINNGCHMIDTLRYLIGDFRILKNSIRVNNSKQNIDSISAICSNQKWDILINSHSQIPSNFSITVNSDNKVYELKPIEKLSIYEGMDIVEPTRTEPIRKYLPHLKESILEKSDLKPGFERMHKNFKLFCEKKESQICTLRDAFSTIDTAWKLIECETSKSFDFNKS